MKEFTARIYKFERRWYWQLMSGANNKLLATSLGGFQNRAGVIQNLFLVTGTRLIDGVAFTPSIPNKTDDLRAYVFREK